MKKIFPFLILISALAVSASAAFYSIYGISNILAGKAQAAIIMATTIEVTKIIAAVSIHRYIRRISPLYTIPASIFVGILMLITSFGVFGFLSNAYQMTATQETIVQKEIGILDFKKETFTTQKNDLSLEKEQITSSISDLRKSLSNPAQVQYIDKESGQLITTTSSATRKSLEKQLDDAIERRNRVDSRLASVTDSIVSLEIQIVEKENNAESSSELSTLKYISAITGESMDTVVKWFLLCLVFVLDPLAVLMVIFANKAFEIEYGKHLSSDITDEPEEFEIEEPKSTPPPVDNFPTVDDMKTYPIPPVSPPPTFEETNTEPVTDNPPESKFSELRRKILDNVSSESVGQKIKNSLPNLGERETKNMPHQKIEEYIERIRKMNNERNE